MNTMKLVAMAAACILSPAAAVAQEAGIPSDIVERYERSNWAFGIVGSSLGIGAEASVRLHPNFMARFTANYAAADFAAQWFTISTQNSGLAQTSYQGDTLTTWSGRAILDWHLFRDGARLSAGVAYLNLSVEGHLKNSTDPLLQLGANQYAPAQYKDVTVHVKNKNSVLPYVGMGYDSAFFKDYGLSLSTDFGVLLGFDTTVTVDGKSVASTDRKIEADAIHKKLSSVPVYPVMSLAAKYRF